MMSRRQNVSSKLPCCHVTLQHFVGLNARPHLKRHSRPDPLRGMQLQTGGWYHHAPRPVCCRSFVIPVRSSLTTSIIEAPPHMVNVCFKLKYRCAFGQTLVLAGDVPSMGRWHPSRGQRMRWSRGDIWTCNVMIPAGTALRCKYVIVDDRGTVVRWQDGGNIVVRIPATCQDGAPVERYDVNVSWCKTASSFRARPASPTSAAAAAIAAVFAATIQQDTTSPAAAGPAAAANVGPVDSTAADTAAPPAATGAIAPASAAATVAGGGAHTSTTTTTILHDAREETAPSITGRSAAAVLAATVQQNTPPVAAAGPADAVPTAAAVDRTAADAVVPAAIGVIAGPASTSSAALNGSGPADPAIIATAAYAVTPVAGGGAHTSSSASTVHDARKDTVTGASTTSVAAAPLSGWVRAKGGGPPRSCQAASAPHPDAAREATQQHQREPQVLPEMASAIAAAAPLPAATGSGASAQATHAASPPSPGLQLPSSPAVPLPQLQQQPQQLQPGPEATLPRRTAPHQPPADGWNRAVPGGAQGGHHGADGANGSNNGTTTVDGSSVKGNSLVATLVSAATNAALHGGARAHSYSATSAASTVTHFAAPAPATSAAGCGPAAPGTRTTATPAAATQPAIRLAPASADGGMSRVLASSQGGSGPSLMESPTAGSDSANQNIAANAVPSCVAAAAACSAMGNADTCNGDATAVSPPAKPAEVTVPNPTGAAAWRSAGQPDPWSHNPNDINSRDMDKPCNAPGTHGKSAAAVSTVAAAPVPPAGVNWHGRPSASTWDHEYDVYATVYGTPCTRTPSDPGLYSQHRPEPYVSPSAPVASPPAPAVQHHRLAPELLMATAASTALALAAAGDDDEGNGNSADAASATAVAAAATATRLPRGPLSAHARTPMAAAATSAVTVDSASPLAGLYRVVSRSSPSVRDWAGRTLFELSAARTRQEQENEGDESETADEEAAMAAALMPPSAPAEMTALLQQLGTALGRSVRLRYDGADAAAADVLQLDREIALAASRLYRKRDALLTGWVRQEARRQLAAVTAAAAMAATATSGGRQVGHSVTRV